MNTLKPMERSDNPRPTNAALRRHHFGPIQAMQPPSLLERLINWVRR
jgi:hypothetical protein